MKKLILFISLFSIQIYGQNMDLEKTINLIITEITPSNFKYINLVDENLIEKEFDYSIQNYQKREILIKDSLFPIELITRPKEEKNRLNWKNFKLNNCKIYTKNDCIGIVRNSKHFIEVKNKSENTEKNIEDQFYFSFSIPTFSENKKYFRITIYEGKKNNGKGSSKIYKIENNTITEIFEYNKWSTLTSTLN